MTHRLLRAAQVITATGADPIPEGAVRVQDGKIAEVGPAAALDPGDAEVIDLGAGTLLPGLVECHEHLNGHGYYAIGDYTSVEPDALFALLAGYHAGRLIDIGVTTARMVGAPGNIDLLVRRAIAEGFVDGPRLICAGQPICMTGGHGAAHCTEVDGPWEATKAARKLVKSGVDLIKVMASGGVGITREGEEPSQPQLTEEEMRAVCDVAHWAGIRVAAHADGPIGIGNAIRAGVDTIEHGIYMTAEQAHEMAERGTMLVPTLSTMHGIHDHGISYGMPADWIPIAAAVLEPHRQSFQHALDAGVLYGPGTDGFGDIVDELKLFTTYGISALRAIEAGTRDAATIVSASPDFGTLQPGKAADIIAVEGDPLQDLEVLRAVRLVMTGGTIRRQGSAPRRPTEPAPWTLER